MRGGTYVVTRRIRMLIEIVGPRAAAATRSRRSAALKVSGRAARRAARARRGEPAARRRRRPAGDPGRRAHPARRARRRTAARRSCAAATRSPTASTRRPASSTPGCSSSPSSATRTRSSCRSSGGSATQRRAQRVHQAHVGSALFAVPPGASPSRPARRRPVRALSRGEPRPVFKKTEAPETAWLSRWPIGRAPSGQLPRAACHRPRASGHLAMALLANSPTRALANGQTPGRPLATVDKSSFQRYFRYLTTTASRARPSRPPPPGRSSSPIRGRCERWRTPCG